jgi:hypothetical protein
MADVDENAYAALGLAFEDAPSEATIKKVRRARDRATRDARDDATRATRRFRIRIRIRNDD